MYYCKYQIELKRPGLALFKLHIEPSSVWSLCTRVLCIRPCVKCFLHVISFHLQDNSMVLGTVFILLLQIQKLRWRETL